MLVGDRPQVLWEGLAELRADTPSKTRGAEGERGRPPPPSNTQRPITQQTRPTKKATFPRNKAEKSPFQQHDLSILQVGSHQLQYRFFRINNPKSRHKTNTFCPLTLIVGPNQLKCRLSGTRKPKSHPSSNTQCPITRGTWHETY